MRKRSSQRDSKDTFRERVIDLWGWISKGENQWITIHGCDVRRCIPVATYRIHRSISGVRIFPKLTPKNTSDPTTASFNVRNGLDDAIALRYEFSFSKSGRPSSKIREDDRLGKKH